MRRQLDPIVLAFLCFFATGPTFSDERPAPFDAPQMAQEISLDYLERLVIDLIASGAIPPDSTVCTVDWLRFGILVKLQCDQSGEISDTPGTNRLAKGHEPGEQGLVVRLLACDTADTGYQDCMQRLALSFRYSMTAITRLDARMICDAVTNSLNVSEEFTGEHGCPAGRNVSRLDSRSDDRKADVQLIVNVNRRDGTPPIFTGFVIGQPRVLDNENGDHFERHDFIIYWAFLENGDFEVNVEPIFAMYGTLQSLMFLSADIDKLLSIEFSRRTRVRPQSLADDISEHIDTLTTQQLIAPVL